MRYRAVLFDLFDTLVRFDRRRLPVVEIGGRTVHSTVGHLHAQLAAWAPAVTVDACYEALVATWQDAERRRAADHREVGAPERFEALLRRLAVDPATCPAGLLDRLLTAHGGALAAAAEFPAPHVTVLDVLRRHHRLAVVSNFDYSPTALGILERAGVVERFAAIVISDAVGWRKPRPEIFQEALARLDVPAELALFVGDRADIDVAGAHGVGMHAVWINRAGEPLPPGVRPPEFEIRDLTELPPLVV